MCAGSSLAWESCCVLFAGFQLAWRVEAGRKWESGGEIRKRGDLLAFACGSSRRRRKKV